MIKKTFIFLYFYSPEADTLSAPMELFLLYLFQITGMGTALKILFSGDSMAPDSTVTQQHKKADIPFQLTRNEIVALINAFGR